MLSIKRRANIIANWLLEGKSEKLGSRQCDNYFEEGDGLFVVRELLQVLGAAGVMTFTQLPLSSQRYACREWWTSEQYQVEPQVSLF